MELFRKSFENIRLW